MCERCQTQISLSRGNQPHSGLVVNGKEIKHKCSMGNYITQEYKCMDCGCNILYSSDKMDPPWSS